MFDVLRVLEARQPRLAHRVTLRRLLQWCEYTNLEREVLACKARSFDEAMANLALGTQVRLLSLVPLSL